jgi:AraC-like DNA-binding protein/anti-anti-sigma regulatory factor
MTTMVAPEPALTITDGRLGQRRVLRARGRIDHDTAPRLTRALNRATASDEPLAVDLCAAEVSDPVGTVLVLNAIRRLHARQPELIVICSHAPLREALDRAGLARRFAVVGDAGALADVWPGTRAGRGAVARAVDERAPRASTFARRAELLADATLAIELRHADPHLALPDIARDIATSSRQLQRVFAELAGSAFRHELAAVRAQHAAELLQTTSLPVAVVARRVGYSQTAQFAKAFRRHHGVSPSLLRRATRRRAGGANGAFSSVDPARPSSAPRARGRAPGGMPMLRAQR